MRKGKSLQLALHSQQQRLKEKERVSHAARITAEGKKLHGKLKTDSPRGTAKPTIPFKPTDRVLLVGEGNFSYAHALVRHPPREMAALSPGNITATAYDTEETCYEKYPDSRLVVSSLREVGVEVIFGIDGTRLERYATLKGRRWDRIVWNFPHAGQGITDQDRNILANQVLILGFFRSAAKILQVGQRPCLTWRPKWEEEDSEEDNGDEDADRLVGTRGTVLITLRNVVPYTLWDVPRLAKKPPPASGSQPPNPTYTLLRSFKFHRNMWRGYEHCMTKGERAHGRGTTGTGGEDRTWEFYLSSNALFGNQIIA